VVKSGYWPDEFWVRCIEFNRALPFFSILRSKTTGSSSSEEEPHFMWPVQPLKSTRSMGSLLMAVF
jgi:hypothetical protein